MKSSSVFILSLIVFFQSLGAAPLEVLFLGGGSGSSDSGHNGRINHHKLIPQFLRSGIKMTYSDRKDDLNPQTLADYDVVVLYTGGNGKVEQTRALISFVEKGGGLVAIHHSCAAFEGDKGFVSLIGGEFARHGSGWFTAKHVEGQAKHPSLGGVAEFEAWDETFAHKNLNEDRIDLQVRYEKDGHPEPWTWIRKQGKGRVFYTAHGHDHKVWEHPNFQRLITAATHWTANRTPDSSSEIPTFSYREDKEEHLHNHEKRRGFLKIQEQLTPEESARCLVLPEGFEAQLVAHEPDIKNPIDVIWDDRGRMYVAETSDYPQIKENGSDRIIICEDLNDDGRMDSFKVFAEGFSLHTGMCWVNGGIILTQAPHMYFLKDTDGDDRADHIEKINSGWGIGDLHGGPSNMQYGFDNKIYGCIGGGGYQHESGFFGGGIWRMEVDGTEVTPISSLGDNSFALGISEDFELFASSANRGPAKHIHAPYPYFEAIGLKKVPARKIFDFHTIYPLALTRQIDHFGSYTSGAGFDLYTARSFPEQYWNQSAFVGSPVGKLLGQFFLHPDGQGSYHARNSGSLVASFDEYTAPIRGKTGPDGHVYMLDWNNLIMLHGSEINNPLRDKSHGRIYRIVHNKGQASKMLNLHEATDEELVDALKNDNLFWRVMAQQKLVQQKRSEAIPLLIELAKDRGIDAIGSNPSVIHALWTLHGLGQLNGTNQLALEVAQSTLQHPSAAVRKNAVRVLPANEESRTLIEDLLTEKDANALRQVLLTLSTMPASNPLGERLYAMKKSLEGKPALEAPFQLALIRHGSALVEPLLAKLPARKRQEEAKKEETVVEMENLIANPSFEDLEEGLPLKWISKVHNGQAKLSVDALVARTGNYSGRIDSLEGGGAEFLKVSQLEKGEYLFTAWVKTKDIKGQHGVLLRASGRGVKEVRTEGLKGSNEEWQQLQLNFRVSEESGVLLFCLFGAWSPATGTAWYDDVALYQLSSEKVVEPAAAKIETLLGKQAFSEGAETIIRLTKLAGQKSSASTDVFMEGLTLVEDATFNEKQIETLKNLAAEASPKNQEHLAIFALNNELDLGLGELATQLKGFEAKIHEGNIEQGRIVAKACIACHGNKFEGRPELRAPSLTSLSDWYLQTQLQKFKHGIRGHDVSDADGFVMHQLMMNYSHQQIADVAAYIKTHPEKKPESTLGGDPEKGKEFYAACIACHQEDAQGNQTLNAPSLTGLSDRYLVKQLQKFKEGKRGGAKGDLSGKLMQMSVSSLKDEQAMKDVAAYLTTLPLSKQSRETK